MLPEGPNGVLGLGSGKAGFLGPSVLGENGVCLGRTRGTTGVENDVGVGIQVLGEVQVLLQME